MVFVLYINHLSLATQRKYTNPIHSQKRRDSKGEYIMISSSPFGWTIPLRRQS
jgi:hypothetical protein